MIETIFNTFESAVSPSNFLITFFATIGVSFILGKIWGKLRKSIKENIIVFFFLQIFFVLMYFVIKDKVATYRYSKIEEAMLHVKINTDVSNMNIKISSWQTGLKAIQYNPREVGYYLKTTDYLEKEKDYRSAALLIEMGLDYIKQSPIPPPLCKKLKSYYKYLEDRPKITDDCETFIEITN